MLGTWYSTFFPSSCRARKLYFDLASSCSLSQHLKTVRIAWPTFFTLFSLFHRSCIKIIGRISSMQHSILWSQSRMKASWLQVTVLLTDISLLICVAQAPTLWLDTFPYPWVPSQARWTWSQYARFQVLIISQVNMRAMSIIHGHGTNWGTSKAMWSRFSKNWL